MGKTTITFRLDADKREALDAIAEVADRDRSYVLNEAVDAYLDVHQWQIEHIKKGLRQAEAGQFAAEKEVARAFARWRR
jgi:predicted transcriptional regulator